MTTSTETTPAAWDDELLKDPHAVADKRGRVQRMFAAIAPSYDLNNRLHSLGTDQLWRRRAVKLAAPVAEDVIIDVACGTGDLTLKFLRALERIRGRRPPTGRVMGVDLTFEMLPLARRKGFDRSYAPGAGSQRGPVLWVNGDALAMPLPDACCDVVSIAFGIRNVSDPLAALREFRRLLRPGGRVVVLEFSLPTLAPLRGAYNFYFRKVLPRTATLVSGDKTGAYRYLPESVNTFLGRERMAEMMREAGFAKVEAYPMTFGVAVCYRGRVAR